MAFACRTCGGIHEGHVPAIGFPEPDPCAAVPEAERGRRVVLTPDTCVLDGEHFFLLGRLEVPVLGEAAPFAWTCWSSLSRTNFERATSLWTKAGRESEPPYFGWLSSAIPGYPETRNLKCHVHTRPVGERPSIELEPTEHPLAVDQRRGVTRDRLRVLVEAALHG